MKVPRLIVALSLLHAILYTCGNVVALVSAPEASTTLVGKLLVFTLSALATSYIFVRREGRSYRKLELLLLAGLCLLWTLAIDAVGLLAIELSPAWAFAIAAAFDVIILHLTFGVVGLQFARWLAKRGQEPAG